MTAAIALDDWSPTEGIGPSLLSSVELEQLRPWLPRRVFALLSAQIALLRTELVLPMLRAGSAEEAWQIFRASSDLVGPVRRCLSLALAEARGHSLPLQVALDEAGPRLAARLRSVALPVVGRTHAIMLVRSLLRASLAGRLWSDFCAECAEKGANERLARAMARPAFLRLSRRSQVVDGLLLISAIALEEPDLSAETARPILRGLLERLWQEAFAFLREGAEWMLGGGGAPERNEGFVLRLIDASLKDRLVGASDSWHLFQELSGEWRDAAGPLSNPAHILRYPAFGQIVELGWEAVPFLLEGCQQADPWFWGPALAQITGEEPESAPDERQSTAGVAQAWLRLAKERGWSVGREGPVDDRR